LCHNGLVVANKGQADTRASSDGRGVSKIDTNRKVRGGAALDAALSHCIDFRHILTRSRAILVPIVWGHSSGALDGRSPFIPVRGERLNRPLLSCSAHAVVAELSADEVAAAR
jgi:hypothetical protein